MVWRSDTGAARRRGATLARAALTGISAATLMLLAVSISAPSLQAQAPGGAPLTLTLGPGRDGTQPGTITFAAAGPNQTMVTIDMTPGGAGVAQPAHIHVGGCPGVGDVKYPLTNVVNGKSVTTLDVARNSLFDGSYSANVHKGPGADSQIYTACVNLSARQSGAGGGPQSSPRGLPATGVGPGPSRAVDFTGAALVTPGVVSLSTSATLSSAGFTPGATVSLTFYDAAGQTYLYQEAGQPATLTASDDGMVSVSIIPAEQVSPAAAPGLWTAVFQEQETGITRSATFQVTP